MPDKGGFAAYQQQQADMGAQPDLQELVRANEQIWVLNLSGEKVKNGQPSAHILEVKDRNGKSHPVTIPATKYPFLLSSALPPQMLAGSPELYAALHSGILRLIDPQEARDRMNEPMAQQAVDQAIRSMQATSASPTQPHPDEGGYRPPNADSGNSHIPSGAVNPGTQMPGDHTEAKPPPLRVADTRNRQATDGQDAVPDGVNGSVVQLMLDLKRNPELREDILLKLVGTDEDQITSEDLGYIIVEAAEHKKMVQWAQGELSKRSGSAPTTEETKTTTARKPPRAGRRKNRG